MPEPKEKKCSILKQLAKQVLNKDEFRKLHWTGTFEDYLEKVKENPWIACSAFQRLYRMILSYGYEEYEEMNEKAKRYRFFDDPITNGKDAIYGLDRVLMDFVDQLQAGASRLGIEQRILLLHGPVGSSKSTLVRLLKKGLEAYTKTDEGALYTFEWANLPKELAKEGSRFPCPMNEEPLKLIPQDKRKSIFEILEIPELLGDDPEILIEGELCPPCRYWFKELLELYKGDWEKVIREHIKIKRLILSEKDRIGIATFQPKDEKNQDSTELTGDINYRKIAIYGSDSDPRAFNFDGELNIANRGLIEFIEILKLEVAFLYDLLDASQEHKIKARKFQRTDIDEVIIGHTNEPEFKKLRNNEYMEAFRDRTVKIDVPYVLRVDDEVKIYEKSFSQNRLKIKGIHLAPHTLEMVAMWAVLTRLEEPLFQGLSLMQKLKLYNGELVPGFTQDNVKEMKEKAKHEGMEGVSPRYVQNQISNAIVKLSQQGDNRCLNPFMVFHELQEGLKHYLHPLKEEDQKRYNSLLSEVRQEYEERIKSDVQRAICMDKNAVKAIAENYIKHIQAYCSNEKIKDPVTGDLVEPDERLMRDIEERIDIPESRKGDFRREIMGYIGAQTIKGKSYSIDGLLEKNERLRKAIELKLFEDQKDAINFSSYLVIQDQESQEKIEIVKKRLIDHYGYCPICATDVLNYVANIFARGETKK